MPLSIEFIFSICIQILTAGVFIGGSMMWQKFIEKQLARIETKQDKYNDYLARLICCEQNDKNISARIDDIFVILERRKEDR